MSGLIVGGLFAVSTAVALFVLLHRLGRRERQQHEAAAAAKSEREQREGD